MAEGRLLDTNGEGRYPTALSLFYPTVDIHCIRALRARPSRFECCASMRASRRESVLVTRKDQIAVCLDRFSATSRRVPVKTASDHSRGTALNPRFGTRAGLPGPDNTTRV